MAISDQDRKLAGEVFDLIERSNPEPAPMTPAEHVTGTCAGCGHEAAGNVTWFPGWRCRSCTPESDVEYIVVTPSPLIRAAVSMALAEHTPDDRPAVPWAQTKLPTPSGYQDMHLDVEPRFGTRYLYMGSDYVAFTQDEWFEFVKSLSYPGVGSVSMALAEHTASAIDKILGA